MNETRIPLRKTWLPVGVILLLAIINVLLIRQNLDLRQQLAAGGRTLDLTTNVLKPGDVVATVTATDLDGRPYQLEYKKDGRHRLLLFFSPNCPYCEQQSPLWRDLLNNVDKDRFNVVGVVSDREDRQSVAAHAELAGYFTTKTPLPVVFFDNESLGSYKLTATPTTLLIDEDGKVEHAWVGKWDESRVMEVAAALKQEN
ncbi:MAG TPA: TlpA disulfide reductase family protein [Pyrinomonadaceae bacterium]|nr:TlpA disulfide reductase family protein [Pyrinomonadaceae bacterium]